MRATVSESFIAMRAKVLRMSARCIAANGGADLNGALNMHDVRV